MAGRERDGLGPDGATRTAAPVGRACIAVIGIDRYRDPAWPQLDNAVGDARGVLGLFTRLGFERVGPLLLDELATGDAIRRLVVDDLAELGPDDSLVVFFAGHGHTVTQTYHGGTTVKDGYLVPVDGDRPDGRAGSWLRLDSWLADVVRIRAKHILVVLDACHSGLALGPIIKWRGSGGETAPGEPRERLRERRSRHIITSALDDQRAMDSGPVPGHSLFTGCLIEAMTGGLFASTGQGVATGAELGHYVQRRVSAYPGSRQTPDFGALDLNDSGQLFVPVGPQAAASSTADPAPPAVRRRPRAVGTWAAIGVICAAGGIVAATLAAGRTSHRSEPPASYAAPTTPGGPPSDELATRAAPGARGAASARPGATRDGGTNEVSPGDAPGATADLGSADRSAIGSAGAGSAAARSPQGVPATKARHLAKAGALAPDPSFSDDGRLVISRAALVRDLGRLRVLGDGAIVATGNQHDPALELQLSQARGDKAGVSAALLLLLPDEPSVLRIDDSGRLDFSFNDRGIAQIGGRIADGAVTSASLDDVTVDTSGRIVVAGHFHRVSGMASVLVARLLASGKPDPSFGDGGLVTIDHVQAARDRQQHRDKPYAAAAEPGVAEEPFADEDHRPVVVSVLPGGQIVIVGSCQRWSRDGNYGATFVTWFDDRGNAGAHWMMHADLADYDFSPDPSETRPASTGYDFTGVDREVDRGLAIVHDSGASASRAVIGDDGSIVAAGDHKKIAGFVMRLAPDGSKDPSFGRNGVVTVPGIDAVGGLAIDERGRILLAGHALAPSEHSAVVRLMPSGARDRAWNRTGTADGPKAHDQLVDLVFAADGSVLGVGYRVVATGAAGTAKGSAIDILAGTARADAMHPIIVRFKPDGTLDPRFGKLGALVDERPGTVSAAAVDLAGRVVTVGATREGAMISRHASPGASGAP